MQMRSRQRKRYHTCRTTSTCKRTPPSSATRPSAEGQASCHQSCPHLSAVAVGLLQQAAGGDPHRWAVASPREARGGGEGAATLGRRGGEGDVDGGETGSETAAQGAAISCESRRTEQLLWNWIRELEIKCRSTKLPLINFPNWYMRQLILTGGTGGSSKYRNKALQINTWASQVH
jgi:hypothetical protein